MIITEDTYNVKVAEDINDYWNWCLEKVKIGTWCKQVPMFNNTATYFFQEEEDSLAFRLRFGLHESKKNLPKR